jgi:hypothetical protein
MILLREMKRLQHLGDVIGEEESAGLTSDAASLESDLDVVTNAIKHWAGLTDATDYGNTVDIAAINSKTLDALRAMSYDEWYEAFDESRRRAR